MNDAIERLVGRYDRAAFAPGRRPARVRVVVRGAGARDVVLAGGAATLAPANGRPAAELSADAETWERVVTEAAGALEAFGAGRLAVRRNLHVGVGFLAATSGAGGPGRLRFRTVTTPRARLSLLEAGSGPAVVALHGLGATKVSFLTTVVGLAGEFRVIAADLPGFGDSDKPIGAA
ncbi:MAG: alpha/beta fold hydrolase, partial [Solirubrobacteraceae bacterium]